MIDPVPIIGAGPTGLALALGLARQGVRTVLCERHAGISTFSKAPGIHIRTREIFRQWGVEGRLLSEGHLLGGITLHRAGGGRPLLAIDFTELEPEAFAPGLLLLEQSRTEALLLEAVRESGSCDVRFGAEVIGLTPQSSSVRVRMREGGTERELEGPFVVGCDGADSFVRQAIGLPFDGLTYAIHATLADVRLDDARDALPWPRVRNRSGGLTVGIRLRPGQWRIISVAPGTPATEREVPDEEVAAETARVLGAGPPLRVVWSSRFRIHRRASPTFRAGRVLLAGDAAHIHSPVGGQGMNAGIQDAHNLAWKLAHALRGGNVDRLLDSYDTERREAVVGRVTRQTDFVTRAFLQTPAMVRQAGFFALRLALRSPALRRRMLRRASMIDLGYRRSALLPPGDRHAGMRVPDALLRSTDGRTVRLYDLLPAAPVLLDVHAKGPAHVTPLPLKHVIRIGPAGYADVHGVLRRLCPPGGGWMLVRPDAHLAWVRDSVDGLREAVAAALGE